MRLFLEWSSHRRPYEMVIPDEESAHVPIATVSQRHFEPFFNTYRPQSLTITWSDSLPVVSVDWSIDTRMNPSLLALLAAPAVAQICKRTNTPYVVPKREHPADAQSEHESGYGAGV